ncbi:hypothetical protein [Riemerella anatipestifer]|uniref:HK97 gp10 family phage protein n=2 Tax=Riemerella anatipestifer TaxID=34085 RepID=J9QZ96_RIEAN|nr:hypothetical protein [Riemerella anatipestifer]WCS66389.1 hypothetical protein CRP5_000034 [Riemerella phage vB_RanS_CRP5]WIL01301.1 hypothetical protein CRP6_000021 [Riemerella phage vB_RanS_CRP6]AFR35965.1 hypothetical protein B739_1367 [Riemerella anatipestifer RA-CH-1]MCO7349843.1 hypothetical protein [Riemerella anatipestifer]MCQ4038277.1 hypothetical protein [Riemerella anatipestifer]
MGLVPKFSMNDINAILKQAEEDYTQKLIRALKFVGEKCVNEAKANGTYQDQTANLRNSKGYVIVADGRVIDENFSISANGSVPSKENPLKYGRELAYQVAPKFRGIALIVVAGMRYASYVESKGRVVLTSAEQLAKIQVPILLKQLQ